MSTRKMPARPTRLDNARVLIYSHDTFGLGHLRRCRAIAHELVGRFKGISVLILSGSPVIASFEFRARVDFVRIPGVIKLKDGSYTSLALHIDLEQTLAMREAVIFETAQAFQPDLFLVDKEPLGLGGEVGRTLRMLRARGARTVLGLRDILDAPEALREEWARKGALPALRDLYDEIWVYGTEAFYHPLRGLDGLDGVARKTVFTGYLRRPPLEDTASSRGDFAGLDGLARPYLLVTPGGGKDGVEMVASALGALKGGASALVVLGPFMDEAPRNEFKRIAETMPNIRVLDSHARIEKLMENAGGLLTMGGYNTFCEILSFNKPAIVTPRRAPRAEQLIRARRAAEWGLVTMPPEDDEEAGLRELIEKLPAQSPPGENLPEGMLHGMDAVCARVVALMGADARAYEVARA
ncbi:MAG: hypothetical protein MPJ81_07490 [Gammaproteobacteria bacterium]|nr:hypothetical protein [Gammaproteobacteria bacterium]